MSLLTRTLFSVFVAAVVSAATGLLGLVSAQHAASKVNYCLSSALQISSMEDLKNLVFEECIHQQIQNEEDNNEINDYMYDFVNKHKSLKQQRWKRYKRQVYQPPQVDEKLVSAFLNSPEAVKMVLSYLDKQKPKTTTTTTTRRPTTRPPKRPKRPRPRPPPKRSPLSFFFGGDKPLSQLFSEHRNTVKKIQEKRWKKEQNGKKPGSTTSKPPTPPRLTPNKPVNNPQLNGAKKADNMQFFGPKDFVPKSPHKLPLRPMRLKYSSTKEFPTKTYGRLVPMPR